MSELAEDRLKLAEILTRLLEEKRLVGGYFHLHTSFEEIGEAERVLAEVAGEER